MPACGNDSQTQRLCKYRPVCSVNKTGFARDFLCQFCAMELLAILGNRAPNSGNRLIKNVFSWEGLVSNKKARQRRANSLIQLIKGWLRGKI